MSLVCIDGLNLTSQIECLFVSVMVCEFVYVTRYILNCTVFGTAFVLGTHLCCLGGQFTMFGKRAMMFYIVLDSEYMIYPLSNLNIEQIPV